MRPVFAEPAAHDLDSIIDYIALDSLATEEKILSRDRRLGETLD